MLGGSLSPQHGASSGCGWRNGLQLWRVSANILNKKLQTNNKRWSSSWGVEREADNTSPKENKFVTKNETEPQTWSDSLDKRSKQWNMDMRFGLWNVRNLYRVGSLLTVLRELVRYKLDSVGVQDVRWVGSGTEPAGEYTFFYRKGNENHEICTGCFVHKRIISAAKKVRSVSDRMSYIILRGCWCHHCSECSCPNWT
jgi:hypothetical protein